MTPSNQEIYDRYEAEIGALAQKFTTVSKMYDNFKILNKQGADSLAVEIIRIGYKKMLKDLGDTLRLKHMLQNRVKAKMVQE